MPHSSIDTDHRKMQKYTELIQKAVPGNATMEGFQAVMDFLGKEQYFEPLENILEAFDATVPPFGSFPSIEGLAIAEQIALASSSISDCVPLFRSLQFAEHRPPWLEAYVSKCMRMILERWTAILRWMTYLVIHTTHSGRHKHLVQNSADALFAILVYSKEDHTLIKQELWFIPGTAKLIYLLLCQLDEQTGKYLILRIADVPGAVCSMAQLFQEAFEDNSVWPVMWLEWKSQAPHTRRKLAAALIGRVQQMVAIADRHNMAEMTNSVCQLVLSTSLVVGDTEGVITQDLERQGFLFEFASALTTLANKAQHFGVTDRSRCWADIAKAMLFLVSFVLFNSANPNRYMPRLLKGGILRCASLCLPWDPPGRPYGESSAVLTLRWIVPFLTRADAHAIVEDRHDLDYFLDTKDDPDLSPNAQRICLEVSMAALRGRQVALAKAGATVNMCSNIEVRTATQEWHDFSSQSHGQHPPSSEQTSALKSCGRCHSVFYCSAACQAEDWTLFHSLECGYLGKRYEHRSSYKIWTHPSDRLDRLHFVELLTNQYLPPLPDYLSAPSMELYYTDESRKIVPDYEARTGTYPAEAAISVFDLVTFDDPWPMDFHKMTLNTHRLTWIHVNHVWDARIQRCVRDVLDEPDKYVLVEGVFPFHNKDSMFVFAKMRYDADAPDGGRYKVVNSAFRIGVRQLTFTANSTPVDPPEGIIALPVVVAGSISNI